MKALLVDDSQEYCTIFLKKMEEFCRDQGLQITCDVRNDFEGAVSSCEEYDIYFLDIELGNIESNDTNGLALAVRLRECFPDKEIVFISFYEQYVWKSFEVKPAAFIRKKVLDDDLYNALEIIMEHRRRRNIEIDIPVSRTENIRLKPAEILYCRSKEHYVQFISKEVESRLFRIKLDKVEEALKEYHFIRVHKSFLVNLEYVKALKKSGLQLANDEEVPISRTHKKETQEALYQWRNKGK